MASLLALQQAFLESFCGESEYVNAIEVKGASPQNRLQIYQKSIRGSFVKKLASLYPLTWKLVGEECADQAAHAFLQDEILLPAPSFDFDEWGYSFPDFLQHYPATQTLPYLADFAHLEWLKQRAYHADARVPLTAQDFKEIPPENYGKLILKLHPSASLFASVYPLNKVLAVAKGEEETVDLTEDKVNTLVIRPFETIVTHYLVDAYFSFFTSLHKGDSLIEALGKVDDSDFDIQEALAFAFQEGLFCGYEFAS